MQKTQQKIQLKGRRCSGRSLWMNHSECKSISKCSVPSLHISKILPSRSGNGSHNVERWMTLHPNFLRNKLNYRSDLTSWYFMRIVKTFHIHHSSKFCKKIHPKCQNEIKRFIHESVLVETLLQSEAIMMPLHLGWCLRSLTIICRKLAAIEEGHTEFLQICHLAIIMVWVMRALYWL